MMKYVMRESAQLGDTFLDKGEILEATPFTSADTTGKTGLYKVTVAGKTTVVYRWELDKYARRIREALGVSDD